MMAPLPLSAFIIARDEERCIGRVIDSVRALASQVVVVDSGSTDRTCDIARERGAEVLFHAWPGYGPQKRFAEDHCRERWLLNLDADEVLSPALQDEIRALFAGGDPPLGLYRIRVTTVYAVHRRPRRGAEYNSVIRLYDRELARFPDHPTWDAITPPAGARVGELRAPCWHYSSSGLDHYVSKFNRYTSLQAVEQPLKPYWRLLLAMTLGLPVDFLKAYVLKRHVTGGSYGFALAVSHAYARFLKNAKMLERHLKQRQGIGLTDPE